MSCASELGSGIWEIFLPERRRRGAVYKYEIIGGDGKLLSAEEPTPIGFAAEVRPKTRRPASPASTAFSLGRWRLYGGARARERMPAAIADVDL